MNRSSLTALAIILAALGYGAGRTHAALLDARKDIESLQDERAIEMQCIGALLEMRDVYEEQVATAKTSCARTAL